MSTRSSIFYDETTAVHVFYDLAEDGDELFFEYSSGGFDVEVRLPKILSDAIKIGMEKLRNEHRR